ncbi:spermidine synthase [Marinobacterium litorale]|uniref:spermidine synthase n=1 Tax=Marinobacterium litorale TaxID=404770 RepID=UPI00040535AC|nr:spermidine synthase [Marinobacterium litorale]
MSILFEEIDSQPSPIGTISLRRRRIPIMGDRDIYEVKLGDEFLMSSYFVDGEIALADCGLRPVTGDNLSVVVGGLGLGYTAEAVLNHDNVGELMVVEYLPPVIGWHQQEKTPLGATLNADPRCRYVQGDFFALSASPEGFDPDQPGRKLDAILLDIDHSPRALLNDASKPFYSEQGLAQLATHLVPGGVFGFWSNEPPEAPFTELLRQVFAEVEVHEVDFHNPFQDRMATNTVYVGIK